MPVCKIDSLVVIVSIVIGFRTTDKKGLSLIVRRPKIPFTLDGYEEAPSRTH